MWRIFPCKGLYTNEYGGSDSNIKAHDLKLDPITVAGDANLNVLKQWATDLKFQPGIEAVRILTEDAAVASVLKEEPSRTERETPPKWTKHLKQLKEWKVISPVSPSDVKCFCKYFAVPKSDQLGRSIFNGRPFCGSCTDPPPVNLPEISHIIELIDKLVKKKGKLFGSVADIRHWFHQIPVKSRLRDFFGIKCDNRTYSYNVLPMGWSHSPWICQALAWTVILHALSKVSGIHWEPLGNELPNYLVLRNDKEELVGYVCLYYDNIGLFTSESQVADMAIRRLKAAFNHANITMKQNFEPFIASRLYVRSQSFQGFEYLGVQFGIIDDNLVWRIAPERIKHEVLQLNAMLAPRYVARLVGTLVWHYTVQRRPLCGLADILDILRAVSNAAGEARSWDVPCMTLEDTTKVRIQQEWEQYKTNAWCNVQSLAGGEFRLAVDSSMKGWGAVLINSSGEEVEKIRHRWPEALHKVHIFVKEVMALCRAVRHFLAMRHGIFYVAEDNSAAKHAVNRLYSSNRLANEEIQRLAEDLEEGESKVLAIGIVSGDNVADCLSREATVVDKRRLDATHRVFEAFFNGQTKRFSEVRSGPMATDGVKHREWNLRNPDNSTPDDIATEDAIIEFLMRDPANDYKRPREGDSEDEDSGEE